MKKKERNNVTDVGSYFTIYPYHFVCRSRIKTKILNPKDTSKE